MWPTAPTVHPSLMIFFLQQKSLIRKWKEFWARFTDFLQCFVDGGGFDMVFVFVLVFSQTSENICHLCYLPKHLMVFMRKFAFMYQKLFPDARHSNKETFATRVLLLCNFQPSKRPCLPPNFYGIVIYVIGAWDQQQINWRWFRNFVVWMFVA